ncbi:MAG: hypothetical protein LKE31_05275 [Bacilli bacterium]|jgi:hypothetical protein|nr:hypothetical protein [Bacilli bacterium]
MQKKLLLSIVSVGAVAVGAGVVATHGQDLTVAEEGYSYSCASVNFLASGIKTDGKPGDTTYDSGAYGIDSASASFSKDVDLFSYNGFGDNHCTFSGQNAYAAAISGKTPKPLSGIKLSSSKNSGSFTITLPTGIYAKRAGLWVSSWSGETPICKVNSSATQTVTSQTYSSGNITWELKNFDIDRSNSIVISTTSTQRLIIGMVVFRIVE